MIEKDATVDRSTQERGNEEQEQQNEEKNVTWRDMWTKIKSHLHLLQYHISVVHSYCE